MRLDVGGENHGDVVLAECKDTEGRRPEIGNSNKAIFVASSDKKRGAPGRLA
jgi:hypothetical protein